MLTTELRLLLLCVYLPSHDQYEPSCERASFQEAHATSLKSSQGSNFEFHKIMAEPDSWTLNNAIAQKSL